MSSPYKVIVLHEGYSRANEIGFEANCTCTLIKGPENIIVDTMTVQDGPVILNLLSRNSLKAEDISLVVSTHGHPDHIGGNYLFRNSLQIVGYCISKGNLFYTHDFKSGIEYKVDDFVKVIPTPGHTLQDVSVVVETQNMGVVVVAGDLFENETDLSNDEVWKSAGSDCEELQRFNRERILRMADWIVPGHGPMFKVEKRK